MPILYVLFFWVYVPYKIISWIIDTFIGDPIQRAIDSKVAKAETDKAFGKLNHEIEVYNPDKDRRNAD